MRRATPSHNSNMIYSIPSPRKRPRVDSRQTCSTPLRTTLRGFFSDPPSPCQSQSKALQAAKDFDSLAGLTPSKTILAQRPLVIPPKPVTYVHRHPDSYINAIIAKDISNRAQRAALRTFLDAFCYQCGFRTSYQTPNNVTGMNPDNNSVDFKGRKTRQYTQGERKMYIRYDAVVNTLRRIPNMGKKDHFLSGLDRRNCLFRKGLLFDLANGRSADGRGVLRRAGTRPRHGPLQMSALILGLCPVFCRLETTTNFRELKSDDYSCMAT
jgi:hypothetical protein